jgi:hypothetical protein
VSSGVGQKGRVWITLVPQAPEMHNGTTHAFSGVAAGVDRHAHIM